MKIASWNVNSLKVRLPQLMEWLDTYRPDIVCLQETKLEDHAFPQQEIEAAGYSVCFSGQKTYNGVALLSRMAPQDIAFGNPHFADPQKRLIAASIGSYRVICAYVPNGQEVGSDKYAYKLDWLRALHEWLSEEIAAHSTLIVAGDFNIAPDDRDVYDPLAWSGKILCSDAERSALGQILNLGLKDSFRLFDQPERTYSWWDYRMLGFQKNRGLRIDHILVSDAVKSSVTACTIDRTPRKNKQPSDHTPVIVTLG